MTQHIIFATGNKGKFMSMQRHIARLGVDAVVEQAVLELTEPQADTATEVAQSKAKQAYAQLGKAVLVDDSSFHIAALGGFPGPYIKYMLTTIGIRGILDFMKGKTDRSAYFLSSLVYIDDNGEEHIFNDAPYGGVITEEIDPYESEAAWSELYKIFIPTGSDKVLARMTPEDHAKVDKGQVNAYEDFCEWVRTQKSVDAAAVGYSQKYALVHFLEPVANGFEYASKNWPLHTTLVDTFAIDWTPSEMMTQLSAALRGQTVLAATALEDAYFGENSAVQVTHLRKTGSLVGLHETLVAALQSGGLVLNDPQFAHDGFLPHVTVQKTARVTNGDTVTIDSVSIVDMFPESDPFTRKVVGTIAFHA